MCCVGMMWVRGGGGVCGVFGVWCVVCDVISGVWCGVIVWV